MRNCHNLDLALVRIGDVCALIDTFIAKCDSLKKILTSDPRKISASQKNKTQTIFRLNWLAAKLAVKAILSGYGR